MTYHIGSPELTDDRPSHTESLFRAPKLLKPSAMLSTVANRPEFLHLGELPHPSKCANLPRHERRALQVVWPKGEETPHIMQTDTPPIKAPHCRLPILLRKLAGISTTLYA